MGALGWFVSWFVCWLVDIDENTLLKVLEEDHVKIMKALWTACNKR